MAQPFVVLRAYFSGGEEAAAFRSKQLQGYLTRLHDPNVAVRRGFAAALGALPAELLGPQAEEVREACCGCLLAVIQ